MKETLKTLCKLCCTLLCVLVISCTDSSDEQPTPPEPESTTENYQLEENVIVLEDDELVHISSVEDMSIIYKGNTPKENLPQVGEIILVPNPNKIFPSGFLGEVIKTYEQGDQYHIETESVAIDEAFTYLNVSQSYELTPDAAKPITRGIEESETDFVRFTRPIETDLAEGISVDGELTLGIKVDVALNIDKRNGKKIRSGKITTSTLQHVDVSLDVELEKEYEKSVNLTPTAIPLPPLQLGPITLVPALQPYLFIQADGKIETHPSMTYQQIRTAGLNFDGNSWNFNNDDSKEPVIEFNLTPDIHMEGCLYEGVGVALEFRLFGSENAKAFIDAKLGPQISGEVTLATNPNLLYESGKDSYLEFCMQFTAGGGAGLKFFSIEKEWSNYPINLSFIQSTRYFFPKFQNSEVLWEKVADGSYIATATTTLSRDLLFKTHVGIAIYGEDNSVVSKSDSYEYMNEEDFSNNPLYETFAGIPQKNTAYTYTMWGDKIVKGEPIPEIVKERKIKQYTHSSDDIYGWSETYSFTYNESEQIEKIEVYEKYGNENTLTDSYDFDYTEGKTTFSVKVTGEESENKYTLDITLNESGYIKSCKQTFSDEEVDTWTYEYNDDNQLSKMYRSEGNETWELVYENRNVTKTECEDVGSSTMSYGSLLYMGSAIPHELLYGIDIDEMEVFGLIGLLGKPSTHLPTQRSQRFVDSDEGTAYTYDFSWDTDEQGYPTQVGYLDDTEKNTVTFTWED